MDSQYLLRDPSQVFSPGLLFYRDVIRKNIAGLVARVSDPKKLRPHVKKMHAAVGKAVEYLTAVLDDPEVFASTKVRAAESIIRLALQLTEHMLRAGGYDR